MNWVFIEAILGSIVTSSHDTQEACEGRKVMLEKKEIKGQCIQQNISNITLSGPMWYNNSCTNCATIQIPNNGR
jgi:hypothetical protein